jgi:hypothetical protein
MALKQVSKWDLFIHGPRCSLEFFTAFKTAIDVSLPNILSLPNSELPGYPALLRSQHYQTAEYLEKSTLL